MFKSKTGWNTASGASNGSDVLGLNFVPSGSINTAGDKSTMVGDFFLMWAGPEVTEKLGGKDYYTKASNIMIFGDNEVQYTNGTKFNGAAVRCLMDL